ncbi:unnamed protein product [Eruca vesicaria subsp. sativa]|uniref:Uncharacterized protein n=1 Tax=Eruca vesicaria subsp. sativa TaxID=29727 RepID=A0ABC8IZX7_ERUVS|nr:unnamed protein product [Eruca vesicaria subsp. sativa]
MPTELLSTFQQSVVTGLDHMCLPMDNGRFRFQVHVDLNPTVDIVDHMKLLNGELLIHRTVLDEVEIANTKLSSNPKSSKIVKCIGVISKQRPTDGPSSFVCSKCGNENIHVYDNKYQAVFVLVGDEGRELTGKHASRIVDKYFKVNGDLDPDHEVLACPTNFDRHHWIE